MNEQMRCRYVATGINREHNDAFYAATPPLDAKRMLFSRFAQRPAWKGKKMKLSFIDVTKTYFNAIPKREVYVRVPKQLGLPPAKWANWFVAAMAPGTPACCGKTPTQRFSQQPALCVAGLRHAVSGIRSVAAVVCQGDDFSALGTDDELTWYEGFLAEAFELRDKTRLGPGPQGAKEVRILNRILRLDEGGLSYEADPRHVELPARSLNLTQRRRVGTTCHTKTTDDAAFEDSDSENQNDHDASENRCTALPVPGAKQNSPHALVCSQHNGWTPDNAAHD